MVQVSPIQKNSSETSNSLSFAQRVRGVELGAAAPKCTYTDYNNENAAPASVSTTASILH